MNLKKISEKETPLLHRKRIYIEFQHEKQPTPTREDLKKQISQFLKVNENLIAIRHIFTNYGQNKSKIIVHLYEDEDTLKKLEEKKKIKKTEENVKKKEKTKKT